MPRFREVDLIFFSYNKILFNNDNEVLFREMPWALELFPTARR